MFRRFKCLLITSCALALMLLVLLQYKGHSFSIIQESRNIFDSQATHKNASDVLMVPTFATTPSYNPVPSADDLQKMSHKDIQALYHSYINSPQIACSRVERMGKLTDGGWELCDDPLYRPPKGDCLIYSYGINFDYSFDDEMAAYGCEVHAFDPSMSMAPTLRGERVFFHPSGVGAKDGIIKAAPKYETWQLYTINSHRKMLQHAPNQRRLDILKMDVEGYELEALTTALDDGSLSDVKQLAFETHVAWGNYDPTKEQYMQFLALLRKVYEKGFRIYLTHRNYVYSAFDSMLVKGKKRAYCHEIHTVNIHLKNVVNPDGSVVGDGAVSDGTRQERHNQQVQLLTQEQASYSKQHSVIGFVQNVLPKDQPQNPVQVNPPPQVQPQPQIQPQNQAQSN